MKRYSGFLSRILLIVLMFGPAVAHGQSKGQILAWGNNDYHQCNVPAPNADFIAVAGGGYHSLGLKSDGTIVIWGDNDYGECNVPEPNADFIAVAGGHDHSLGLKSNGTIVAWGFNNYGQCNVPAPNADFIAVASLAYHSLGIKSDGTIVAWGYNYYGQCNVPAPNADFIAVASGACHSLGIKSDGTIVAWGYNDYGQCNVPAPNADFIAVAGGSYHSLGIKSDGTIVAWGQNNHGQCNVPAPNADFIAVAGGSDHSLGLKNDGTIVAWGWNNYGQCNVPAPNEYFIAVAGGCFHSLGLLGLEEEPVCSVAPLGLDFGCVWVGRYEDREFVVTNTGGNRLTGSIDEACDFFEITAGAGPYDLGSNDSLFVTVRFAPLTSGAKACTIAVGEDGDSVICTGTGDRAPRIHAVRDVPGDQGGFLNLAWDASPGDNVTEHIFTRYTVWRAIDPVGSELSNVDPVLFILSACEMTEEAPVGEIVRIERLGSATFYWKLISSVDAYFLSGYSEVVPTLFDSTATCDEYHYMQVIAHTVDPYIFWVSSPDSGRSVDNLAPSAPLGFVGEQSFEPEGLNLSWAPNREKDLSGYRVYRGVTEEFIPDESSLVAASSDTMLFDAGWSWSEIYYYKLSALDVNGNESGWALLSPGEVTGDELPVTPRATNLSQNYPNPFNPSTRIKFNLAEPGHVSLRVYDAGGRLVRVLVEGKRAAGRYEQIWDGRDASGQSVASGVYFYRLRAGDYSQTHKMVLLR